MSSAQATATLVTIVSKSLPELVARQRFILTIHRKIDVIEKQYFLYGKSERRTTRFIDMTFQILEYAAALQKFTLHSAD